MQVQIPRLGAEGRLPDSQSSA